MVQIPASGEDFPGDAGLETTLVLLERIRSGDVQARDRLLTRYMAALQRWAHGRLPPGARDLADTDDLVQVTLIRALKHIERFELRRPGAFLSFLRQILLNQVRDEIRKARRRPEKEGLADDLAGHAPSPLEQAIGKQTLESYEAALQRLPERHQEAVVLRIEMGFTNEEIAQAIGAPSANAARMFVVRALMRLAEEMDGGHEGQDS